MSLTRERKADLEIDKENILFPRSKLYLLKPNDGEVMVMEKERLFVLEFLSHQPHMPPHQARATTLGQNPQIAHHFLIFSFLLVKIIHNIHSTHCKAIPRIAPGTRDNVSTVTFLML